MRSIQFREAKSTLSHVVDEAVNGHPSLITRHGKPEAVVLSYRQWQKLSAVPSFGRLLMAAPEGLVEVVERSGSRSRDARF